ncbi:MAG TPA: hypothetical protein VE999_22145 [Gemmataceae bacterium]|nr:hypothetical protein [Gemmataceae bacterium]
MSDPTGDLAGFAYGEDLEGVSLRSLGYRLLAPLRAESWCDEVEALARRLQAAPYSDHWPPTDLFCSVLLADGRRVVALARYGLADHTPSQRRGGLELIGVVAPANLDVSSALAIYQWLSQRREAVDDLHQLGGRFSSAEILTTVAAPPETDPIPVLPVRLWQEGALLFAASTPAEPDHRLRLLEQATGSSWQWLPLVGADFPLHSYAQRGPLIAWTPHLAGVALKLDRKSSEMPVVRPSRMSRGARLVAVCLTLLLAGLLITNLWSTLTLHRALSMTGGTPVPPGKTTGETPVPPAGSQVGEASQLPPTPNEDAGRGRFIAALHELLIEQGGNREWEAEKGRLLARYERLARTHKDLRVRDGNERDRITIAAVSLLAERSADRIEDEVRKALSSKGFSDRVIQAACAHVREQFAANPSRDR